MARKDKSAVSGKAIFDKLVEITQQSSFIQSLEKSQDTVEYGKYVTLLNTLRRIVFMQTGAIYGSDAAEVGMRGQNKRIDRPDYETLAQEFLKKKLAEAKTAVDPFANFDNELDRVADALHIIDWFEEFSSQMLTIQPHTRNQTPHPTITTTVEAFEREADLVDFLQDKNGLRSLLQTGQSNFSPETINRFLQRLEALANSLEAPAEPLTIDDEMRMSLRMSYHIYRSIPENALSFLRIAEKTFGLKLDDQLTNGKTLREQIIENGSKAILAETWSPGDVDSKPHMRPAQMVTGIRMGRLAIRKQYIQDLANIAVQLGDTAEDIEAKNQIKAVIWKLYNDIEELYLPNVQLADTKIEWFLDHITPEMGDDAITYLIKYQSDSTNAEEELLQRLSAAQKMAADELSGIANGFSSSELQSGSPQTILAIKAYDRELNAEEISAIRAEFGDAAEHILARREQIRANLPAQNFLKELREIHSTPEVRRSRGTLRHLYKASSSIQRQKEKGDKMPKSAHADITGVYDLNNELFKAEYAKKYGEFLNSPLLEDFGVGYSVNVTSKRKFSNDPEVLQQDIAKIAQLPALQKIKYKDQAGHETSLAAIDALQMQVNSHGLQAQRITHRQSAEVYATALGELHSLITTSDDKDMRKVAARLDEIYPNYKENTHLLQENLKTLNKMEKAYKQKRKENAADLQKYAGELAAFHQQLMNDRAALTQNLIEFLTTKDAEDQAIANSLRRAIQRETRHQMEKIEQLQREIDASTGNRTLSDDEQKAIYTYESLEMIRLGMYSDGAISRELIAEANHPESLWNVMALQELMQDPSNPPPEKFIPKIVPLVEYPEDLQKYEETIVEAYSFTPFLESQKKLTNEKEHFFLQVWDEEQGMLRRAETRDLLEDIRLNERKGDMLALEIVQRMAGENHPLTKDLKNAISSLQEMDSTAERRDAIYQGMMQKILKSEHIVSEDKTLSVLLHEKVFYMEGMTAGSDAYKSGSSSMGTVVKDAILDVRVAAAAMGAHFVQKFGNGSAGHRSVITNAIIRTRQGLEMAQGAEVLTGETERIRSLNAARRMKLDVGIKQRKQASIVNLGNSAGLKDMTTDAEYEAIQEADHKRMESYQELYATPAFSQFVGQCTPRELLDVYKYAARPAARLKDKSAFEVTGMRAIGYGLANGATMGQPHLNFGMSEHIFEADKSTGMMSEDKLKEKAELFVKSPDLQNMINRSIIDLTQFDAQTGWNNAAIGCRFVPNSITRQINENGDVIIILKGASRNNLELTISDLMAMNEGTQRSLSSHITKQLHKGIAKHPQVDDCITYLKMAATLDHEMTKSLRSVNQLVAELANQKQPEIVAASAPDTLLENLKKLSPQLGEELQLMRKNQLENYEGMTALFGNVSNGKPPKPKHPGSKKAIAEEDVDAVRVYYQNYQYFKRHTDNLESIPAAYYEPGQAVALSLQSEKGLAMAV